MTDRDGCIACQMQIINDDDDKIIKCDGACGRIIHSDCTQLTKTAIKSIKDFENIVYRCDECMRYSLKAINNKVDGLYRYIFEINNRTKENEEAMNNVLVAVNEMSMNINVMKENKKNDDKKTTTTAMEQTVRCVDNRNKKNNNNKQQPVNLNKTNNKNVIQKKNNAKKSAQNREMSSQNHKLSITGKNKTNQKKNKADSNVIDLTHEVQKKKTAIKKVIIKPKVNQSSDKTLDDITQSIDPQSVNIKNIRKAKNGSVIIECENDEEIEKFKTQSDTITNEYDVRDLHMLMPKIKVIGINRKIEQNELIKKIKLQNAFLSNTKMKVIKFIENSREKNEYIAIIQIDVEGFNQIMKKKTIMIGWDKCIAKEHYAILRCHNCSGYNHTQAICTRDKACGTCGGLHNSNECDMDIENCVNCTFANSKYNLSLPTDHNVWSRKCTILNKKIEKLMTMTNHNESR